MKPPSPSRTIEEAAATWAARLESGAFSTADRQELEAWLAADPRHRPVLADFCQFSADLETVLPALAAEGRVELPPVARRQPARKPGLVWSLAGAGALAMAVAAAWIALPVNPAAPAIERIATAATQRQTVTLADGSVVELNAHTSIEFSLTESERRVRLASGQAFFAVAKDGSRPFTVETPAGSVRVTGTHFDVRADPDALLEVTVEEGSVQVRLGENAAGNSPSTFPLQAGNRLTARPDQVTVDQLSADEIADALAWRQGIVVFNGTPLSEVLARFARHHGRGITTTGGAGDLLFGSRVNLDDLDGFLDGLESSMPVRVTRDELTGVIVVRPR